MCSQTREQEELEELLLLEQQSSEQRRLDVLQEEQRQLQAKRKNKQALLDELVRSRHIANSYLSRKNGRRTCHLLTCSTFHP